MVNATGAPRIFLDDCTLQSRPFGVRNSLGDRNVKRRRLGRLVDALTDNLGHLVPEFNQPISMRHDVHDVLAITLKTSPANAVDFHIEMKLAQTFSLGRSQLAIRRRNKGNVRREPTLFMRIVLLQKLRTVLSKVFR